MESVTACTQYVTNWLWYGFEYVGLVAVRPDGHSSLADSRDEGPYQRPGEDNYAHYADSALGVSESQFARQNGAGQTPLGESSDGIPASMFQSFVAEQPAESTRGNEGSYRGVQVAGTSAGAFSSAGGASSALQTQPGGSPAASREEQMADSVLFHSALSDLGSDHDDGR